MKNFKIVAPILAVFILIGFSTAVNAQKMEPQKIDTISNAELEKVAETLQQAKTIQRQANQKLRQAIKETNMEYPRFQTIMRKKQLGVPSDSLNITQEEQETIKKLQPQLVEINRQSKQKFNEALKEHGLTQPRLQQILLVLRTKPEVAQRFQKIIAEQNKRKSE